MLRESYKGREMKYYSVFSERGFVKESTAWSRDEAMGSAGRWRRCARHRDASFRLQRRRQRDWAIMLRR